MLKNMKIGNWKDIDHPLDPNLKTINYYKLILR